MASDNTKIKKLFEFCISGDRIGLADYIITNKCSPSAYDARDSNRQTALHIACQYGHLFVVRSLIEIFGCNTAIPDKLKNVPLHIACLNGHLPIVDYLFSLIKDKDITNVILTPDSEGNNLLHKACQSGSVPTVRYILHALCYPKKDLIHRKLNLYEDSINVYDAASSAKLSSAQVKSFVQCATKANNLGENAIHVACRQGHLMVLKVFEAFFPYNGLFESLIIIAIHCNHMNIIDYLGTIKREPVVDFNSEVPQTKRNSSSEITCERCRHVLKSQHRVIFESTSAKYCQFCSCKLQHLNYEFQCERCSNTFTSNEIVKVKCSRCNSSKIQLSLNNFERLSVLECEQYHMITTFHSVNGLIRGEPSLIAALQGNMKLYLQVYSNFSSTSLTILHAACVSDNVDLVKHIMETFNISVYVNKFDAQGNTPLHVVCEWGSWNVFLYLLSFSELELNKINGDNQTPLSLACKHSRYSFIRKLLESDIKNDHNVLQIICGHGQFDLVEKLVRRWGANTMDCVDKNGDTSLFDACRSGNLELVKFLVKEGSNPLFINETTKDTPVHIACRMSRPDILEALCQSKHINGQSLESNILGVSPVHLAVEKNCFKLVEILIKYFSIDLNLTINKNKVTLAQSAYLVKNVQFLNILLQQPSVNWNAQNSDGNTLLHLACIDNNEDIVKMIAKCAFKSITIQNVKKETPVHIAVFAHNLSLLTVLLQNFSGSLDYYLDEENNTLLHLACGKQRSDEILVEKIICLLSNFCSVISRNMYNETPLHLACKSMKIVSIIDHLLKQLPQSCKLDKLIDDDGNTILHVAAAAFDSDGIVKCILERNTSMILCKTRSSGFTPIHLACRVGYIQIAQVLVSKTKCVEYSTNGDSYLHAACRGKSLDIVKILLDESQLDCQSLFAANEKGDTPFHIACSLGCGEIIKFMIDYCPTKTLSLANNHKNNPFCCLLINHHINLVKKLLSDKIIDDRWISDNQPLLHSVIETVTDGVAFNVIKLIISGEYCDPLKCDKNGNTILHCFVHQLSLGKYSQEFHLAFWKYFLKICENAVNQQNQNGDTVLHMLCKVHDKPAVSYIVKMEYRKINAPLLLTSKLIKHLLAHAESNIKESLNTKNNQGKTPIQLANKQVMKLLIRYGANPQDVYDEFGSLLDEFKSKHPLKSPMKIIVVGNSAAGKTTLVKALNKLVFKQQETEVVESGYGRTAGVETSTLESKELGLVKFHDFAGQPEFESGNSAFLENSVSLDQPPIFLLLADVSTNYETLKKHTQYWFTFIQNHSPQQLETSPHVIILGSHSDCIKESQYQHVEKCMKAAIDSIHSSTFHTIGPFLLDCREVGANLQKLNKMLAKSCSSLRKTVEVDIRCHILFAYLSTWFEAKQSINFCNVQKKIKSQSDSSVRQPSYRSYQDPYDYQDPYKQQFYRGHQAQYKRNSHGFLVTVGTESYSTHFDHSDDFLLPFTTDTLLDLLKSLHSGGHIVLLNSDCPEKCWIVMDSRSIFEKVNGKLFAPKSFSGPKLQTNTGVVSKDMISSLFPSIDPNLITAYTVYSEFCRKIEDSMTLKLIEGSYTVKSTTSITSEISDSTLSYYFFPCLVQCERPNGIWQDSSLPVNNFGWCLQCKDDNYLDPRFLYVVLLRLTFTFATTGSTNSSSEDPTQGTTRLVRKCSIWKNGVYWGTTSGSEVLVEVIEQNSTVILLIRNYVGYEMEGIKLRSQIINMILEAKDEFCPKTKVTEYILTECSAYPFDVLEKISVHDIAQSIAKGDICVLDSKHKPLLLKELLFFDPYLEIGQNLIKQLWCEESSEEEIPPRFFLELSEAQHTYIKQIIKLLDILQSEIDTHKAKWEKESVKLLLHIYESWKSKQDKPCFETLRKIFNSHSIFSCRNPLEFVSLDDSLDTDQQRESPHPKRNMYKDENPTLKCISGENQHTSALLFAEIKPLLDSVSLKHLMCITWKEAETEHKLHILRDASKSWKKIAQTIRMPQEMILDIDFETHKPPQNFTSNVFKWWISQSSTKPYEKTWEGLYQVLNDSGLPELAQQLHEAIVSPENSVLKLNPYKSKSNTKRVSNQRKKRRTSGASNYY